MAPKPPIPITIVTGFLGSGKTTLILNLIPQLKAASPDYRLALLKNEFGDLAVDSQLASSSAISGVREMLNGCICCNLVGDLQPALEELQQATERPDRIIVETSGSAFPATLAMEVNRLARSTGSYVLDGVVSVIDVENWKGYEDTSFTAKKQAEFTDIIVFNKWETAGEDRYEDCVDMVGDMGVDVGRVKSDKGWVSVDVIFGTDGSLAKNLTEDDTNGGHDHAHKHEHGHQSEVEVLSVELQGQPSAQVSYDKLEKFLKTAPKDEIYRIKSVLSLSSRPRNSDPDVPPPAESSRGRYILNWAFGRWTFTAVAEETLEHDSSHDVTLRMTVVTWRREANRWKKKIDAGGWIELDGDVKGDFKVQRIL